MVVKFNARTAASLKPVAGKRMEYFDSTMPGLALRVTEKGVKSWTVLYRHRGRLRRITLGTPKELGLADAREKARDTLREVRDGADPATLKQQARKAQTISDLATEYVERYAKRKKRSWREDARLLRSEVIPQWGPRAIADIKRRDVRQLVEAIAERGAPIMANRVVALLSKVFKFAVNDELIEVSPATQIPRPGREQQRDRVLSEGEIKTLWTEFEKLSAGLAALYKLRLLTGQRGGEVATMRWQDVDLEGGWWTIPASGSKNRLAHRVPLAPMASRLIAKQLQTAREKDVYVLEGARGKRQQSEAAGTFTIEDFRGHDLRRTAASLMASGGVARLTISKILNHVERSVTAIYDRHSYDPEKLAALTWWESKLANTISGGHMAAVLPFMKGA